MLVTGANGAGKTNLLESLHVGTQGFSPRTRADQQLVRLGADGARIALSGDRDGRPLALEVTLQQGGKRAKLNGAAAPLGRAAARGGGDARLHARPSRRRQGRPRRSPGLLRPDARPAAAEPRVAAGRVRGRGRAAERGLAPRPGRRVDARGRRALDRAGRDARGAARRVPTRRARGPVAGLRRARRRARPAGRGARLHGRAADGGGAASSGSSAIWNGASPASARTWTTSPSARASATSAASARRGSSGWPCSRCCSPRPR